jgi:hypothetical protein
MYVHKCDGTTKSAEDSKGILIHGKVEVNLRPSYDKRDPMVGRRFWMDGWDDVMDEAEGLSLYCLDCEEPFAQAIRGMDVSGVEAMLQEGAFTEVEWVDE